MALNEEPKQQDSRLNAATKSNGEFFVGMCFHLGHEESKCLESRNYGPSKGPASGSWSLPLELRGASVQPLHVTMTPSS